jgi:hypothetical protein
VHNSNSDQYPVKAGQTLRGSLVYDASSDAYGLTQTIVETGDSSSQTVKCQDGKAYRVPYVVYEKVFPCRDYPPDGVVTFRNITIECDGQPCTQAVSWQAKVEDANCNMAANIDSAQNTISIVRQPVSRPCVAYDLAYPPANPTENDRSRLLYSHPRRLGIRRRRLAMIITPRPSCTHSTAHTDGVNVQPVRC